MALRASMTGHLVLATLHTKDALGAASRLIDLGVPARFCQAILTVSLPNGYSDVYVRLVRSHINYQHIINRHSVLDQPLNRSYLCLMVVMNVIFVDIRVA